MYRFLWPLTLAAAAASAAAQSFPEPARDASAAPRSFIRSGDTTHGITLETALRRALESNPDLSAAANELQATEAAILQAGVLPNPTLDMSVEDRRRETRESTLQINQPIELGGKRDARLNAATHGKDAAMAELRAQGAEVRAAVITAFFDVLAAQERVRLTEESASIARNAADAVSRRVTAGKVSPVEETKARVAESRVRLELNQAKAELGNARQRLAAVWGDSIPNFDHAEGRLDALPPLPDLTQLSMRLASSPAMQRARYEVERRRALTDLETSRRIPDLTVSLGVKRSEELGRNQAIVGVSIPLPLFDTNRGNVQEAISRTDKARAELQATEIRLRSEMTQAHARLDTARQEVEALQREILPGAQSTYEAAAKGFEFGKFGFLDVLDAQRTLLQARSQYLQALAEAHHAAAEIDRILGEPMPPTEH